MSFQSIQVSPIKEMENRAATLLDVVSLAQGIPSFDTPEIIKRKAIEAIREGKVARYSLTAGILELREAIEYSLAKENIFYDFEKEIIVTAGSIEAISATFLAILNPGDEVIVPDPTYTSYQSAIKVAKGVPVFAALNEKQGWAFNIKAFEEKITPKTRAILFCNPNNPTGTIYTRSQLIELMELAEKHDLIVLSDEVYKDFVYEKEEFFTLAQMSIFRKRLVYIFSFSKAYAMTGWRVAFLAADNSLTEKIIGAHDALVTCAPVVSQWAALAAVELAKNEVANYKNIFKKRRDLICGELDKLNNFIEYQKPSSAYFVFPKIKQSAIEKFKKWQEQNSKLSDQILKDYQKESLSWQLALELLYDSGVALVPGVAFGPGGENHLRLCFGRKEENIVKAVNRMHDFFVKL